MKKTVGILAHVDAGKTTLSERVLFLSGVVRVPGRVDHGDACLDDDPMERARGITIYASLAHLRIGEDDLYWLDTPGHTDFTPEMERALAVLDAAVLVISAAAGVQPHTETLWRLLGAHGIPTFIFLNKTDLLAADPGNALAQLRRRCSSDLADLREWQTTGVMPVSLMEEIALREESLLPLLDADSPPEPPFVDALRRLIAERQIFPVMAGSALTGDGVALPGTGQPADAHRAKRRSARRRGLLEGHARCLRTAPLPPEAPQRKDRAEGQPRTGQDQ